MSDCDENWTVSLKSNENLYFLKIFKKFRKINPLHCVVKFENDVKHEGNVRLRWKLKCKTKIKWELIKFL